MPMPQMRTTWLRKVKSRSQGRLEPGLSLQQQAEEDEPQVSPEQPYSRGRGREVGGGALRRPAP